MERSDGSRVEAGPPGRRLRRSSRYRRVRDVSAAAGTAAEESCSRARRRRCDPVDRDPGRAHAAVVPAVDSRAHGPGSSCGARSPARDRRRRDGARRRGRGLTDHDLVELYRSLVLLRTYDERRSSTTGRAGSARTRSTGTTRRCRPGRSTRSRTGLDLSELPRVGDRASARDAGLTVLSWWRGHPAGWWNPADYNVASICVPIGTHVRTRPGSPGASGCAARARSRSRTSGTARPPRARSTRRELRRRHARAARALLQQQRVGDLDSGRGADRGRDARGQGRRLRDAGVRVDGLDVLAVYEATREAVTRARAGEGPTFIEAVSYRAAPDATGRPKAEIDLEPGRGGKRPRVRRARRGVPAAGGTGRRDGKSVRAEGRRSCATGLGRRGRAGADRRALAQPQSNRPRFETDSPRCAGARGAMY